MEQESIPVDPCYYSVFPEYTVEGDLFSITASTVTVLSFYKSLRKWSANFHDGKIVFLTTLSKHSLAPDNKK